MYDELNRPPISDALAHRLLSAREERRLALLAVAGDDRARELLVRHNLRLVASMAKPFAGRGTTLGDLFQEGTCGLIRAAEKYDPTLGTRFGTYAAWWIRQSLQESVRAAQEVVLPRSLERQRRRLAAVAGRDDEGAATEIAPHELERMRALLTPLRIDQDSAETGRARALEDRTIEPLDELAWRKLRRLEAERVLAACGDHVERVLRLRYGFDDDRERSYKEIARMVGSNHETVRLLEQRSIRELAEQPAAQALRDDAA